jgi:hypothetical protein
MTLRKALNAMKKRWSNAPTKAVESEGSNKDSPTSPPAALGLRPKYEIPPGPASFAELAAQVEAQKRVQEWERQQSTQKPDESPTIAIDLEVYPPAPAAPAPEPSAGSMLQKVQDRSIDQILDVLLRGNSQLSPAEREKLNRAYEMERHRAGLVQDSDPTKPIRWRRFVPPMRPPGFWAMSSTNRMWYCRMEELWQFRQEDLAAAKAALPSAQKAGALSLPGITTPRPAATPKAGKVKKAKKRKRKS